MDPITQVLDGIPVLMLAPDQPRRELVLWLTHLGGSAEQTRPMLERFAAAGHAAVSFDPAQHGRRGTGEDVRNFATTVLASFRQRMWPILGQTTLEAMRVASWAQDRLQLSGPVHAGGASMGGDVAVALAGVDDRVRRVATVGSTPNWSRPDMRRLDDPATVVDQGDADRYAQWYADHLDPSRHPDRYLDGVAIVFEVGAEDRHIPAEHAVAFRQALMGMSPASADRIRVRFHPGLDHFGVATDETALVAAADWLLTA
jgi:uncharacterized protein